jgi:signal transduction histidine kinase
MEEHRLRSRLIWIYIVTIAAILATLLAVLLFFSANEIEQSGRENFSTLITAIGDKLQSGDVVVYSELNRLEQENRLTIRIYDNGNPLLYSTSDDEHEADLFLQVEQTAGEDGYDIASLPLTSERRTSPIGKYYEDGTYYFGAVSIIPIKEGYRTLTIVQRQDDPGEGRWLSYCVLYFAGVLLLGAVGARLIDRALAPAVESRRRQTQFIAAASHELRSPLAVISANLATLPEESQKSPAVEVALAECGRMSRLIGDLLLLASADAGAWTIRLKPVEADTLVLEVYEAYLPLCMKNEVSLQVRLSEERPPQIRGDAERLKQVIGILLDNALAYGVTQERRLIELEVTMPKHGVDIRVIDHGPGLSPEQKAHVFDRFYRADESRRDKQHFGLGLSIASELVARNHGTLDVSDTPGGGCSFQIHLEQ